MSVCVCVCVVDTFIHIYYAELRMTGAHFEWKFVSLMKPINSAETKPDKLNPVWAVGAQSKPDQGARGRQDRQGMKARQARLN